MKTASFVMSVLAIVVCLGIVLFILRRNSSKKGRKDYSIILSWLAIIVSIATMILFFVKVEPNSVVNSDTFISVLAGLVGVMVTLLVGYQIYEAVEMRGKLKELDELRRKFEATQKDLEKEKNKMQEQCCMLMYHVFSYQQDRHVDAFLRLHESLKYIICTEEIYGDMDWYFKALYNAMCWIDDETIGECEDYSGTIDNKVEEFKYQYLNHAAYIKHHQNFYIIKDTYEELMEKFNLRLENIKLGKKVSPREIDGVIRDICEI